MGIFTRLKPAINGTFKNYEQPLKAPHFWDTHPTHLHVPPMRMRPCLGSKNLKRHNLRIFQFGKHQTFGESRGPGPVGNISELICDIDFLDGLLVRKTWILMYTPKQTTQIHFLQKATLWASFMHQSGILITLWYCKCMHVVYANQTSLTRGREHEVSNNSDPVPSCKVVDLPHPVLPTKAHLVPCWGKPYTENRTMEFA